MPFPHITWEYLAGFFDGEGTANRLCPESERQAKMRFMAKNPLTSRTLWFNLITGAVTLLTWAQGICPPEWLPWIVFGISAGNFALRFVTTEPIV